MWIGDRPWWIRGVTYGTFRAGADGGEELERETVAADFERMAAHGINAVRTYTVPPRWLLDSALAHGLRVMVGLPWEQHVAFLDVDGTAEAIVARVREGVRACASHPAVLCYAVGNEIPAPIVRWHGRRRVERFIELLYRTAKAVDPGAPVTYVNYPSTEYLQLPFLDLVCFNVYLESTEELKAYLARLQNLAGNRPLLMAEIGLDSLRHGDQRQAELLDAQLRATFAAGSAGAFVFAWTDEWHRGGVEVRDWAFGLTDRERRPKPALAAVAAAYASAPLADVPRWPRVSVIVCSYNGARTIGDCLEGLSQLEYPDYEVIVVDDGSTDATARIASEHGFEPIRIANAGLSNARNVGLAAADGELVAYIDDDARPCPHWLSFLAAAFIRGDHAGIGGPGIPPPEDGFIAQCVARSPGWPVPVLLSDDEAEHIPGCNMAFRRRALEEIGGFDPQFHTAGDDVDLCWRLRERGLTLGYSPAAMVWHHPRSSLRAYLRQQAGYGRAEALLERKWPEQYNGAGHLSWTGRIYGGYAPGFGYRTRIYHGRWGGAPFQPMYHAEGSSLWSLLLLPESYLGIAICAALALLGWSWAPLVWLGLPLLALAAGALLVRAAHGGALAAASSGLGSRSARTRFFVTGMLLHLLQPLARLYGRLRHGLVPWRRLRKRPLAPPWPRRFRRWSEHWAGPEQRLRALAERLRAAGVAVRFGGAFDRWDLAVRAGSFGSVRLRMAIEEHGQGRQLVRIKAWPRWAPAGFVLAAVSGGLLTGAAVTGAWGAAVALGLTTFALLIRPLRDCAAAMAAVIKELAPVSTPAPVVTGALPEYED